MFQPLGLDPRAESVYRLIVDRPDWGVAEIAEHLGETEQEVRAALDMLVELRLVGTAADPYAPVRVVHPQIGLAGLLARTEADLALRQRQLDAIRAAVTTLATTYTSRRDDAADTIERHDGLDAVRGRLSELAFTARTECLSFVAGGPPIPDSMAAGRPLDELALERGVTIRSVYQDSFRNDPATLRRVRWLADLGGQTRTVAVLPMPLVVVDRETALVPIDPTDPGRGALELRSGGAVAAMCALFETVWRAAVPFDTVPARDDHGLTATERGLLRLLADGATDDLCARRLGVSPRTIRRMSAALHARLQARSRFQAGANAAHRGWI